MKYFTIFVNICFEIGIAIVLAFLVYMQLAAYFQYGWIDRVLLGALTAFFLFLWIRFLQGIIALIRNLKAPPSEFWKPDRSTKKKSKKKS